MNRASPGKTPARMRSLQRALLWGSFARVLSPESVPDKPECRYPKRRNGVDFRSPKRMAERQGGQDCPEFGFPRISRWPTILPRVGRLAFVQPASGDTHFPTRLQGLPRRTGRPPLQSERFAGRAGTSAPVRQEAERPKVDRGRSLPPQAPSPRHQKGSHRNSETRCRRTEPTVPPRGALAASRSLLQPAGANQAH